MPLEQRCKLDPQEWHDWFAWRPVKINTHKIDGRICWTRAYRVVIQRKRDWMWDWEYRLKEEIA